VCHQYQIREREQPERERDTSPEQYTVEPIGADEAAAFILKYEWLGTTGGGRPAARYGARNAEGELAAVALFGHSTKTDAILEGFPSICLERGACAAWAAPNTASWFISRACAMAAKDHGWQLFFAFADEEAGEIGDVYQRCSWLYIGRAAQRARRIFSDDVRRTFKSFKHRYVCIVGPGRTALRKRLVAKFGFMPYPKRPLLDEHANQYDAGRASRDPEIKAMGQEIAVLTAKLNGYVLVGDRHRTPHVLKDGAWTKVNGCVFNRGRHERH
jgi:hypothetical protein